MNDDRKWKTLAYLIGGIAGLAAGLAGAFLFVRTRQEAEYADQRKLTSGEGMKIGMGVVSLLKLIADGGIKK